jgi:hypothetical protein
LIDLRNPRILGGLAGDAIGKTKDNWNESYTGVIEEPEGRECSDSVANRDMSDRTSSRPGPAQHFGYVVMVWLRGSVSRGETFDQVNFAREVLAA